MRTVRKYKRKILVGAFVAFAVHFLATARDVEFKWYATSNGFLGTVLRAEFLAAAGAAGLDCAVAVLFLRRVQHSS